LNPEKTKVALLGAGFIADYHLAGLLRVPSVEVVGICDLSRTRAERLAAQAPGAGAYSDLGQLLAERRPAVVHVLTPPPAHVGPARQALEFGAAVFAEKPLAVQSADCEALAALASSRSLALGVAHNFLFSPPYQRLLRDVQAGRLGRLDQVDVVWNKALPQVQAGPFGGWLFRDPRNVLFEVGPHSFAHVSHLVGALDHLEVEARDPVRLPNDLVFYRQWEVLGQAQRIGVRMRLSFIDGYPEHYIHLRGSAASAVVDFEQNSYLLREHARDLLDFDRFAASWREARDSLLQATATLGSFVLSKAGLPFEGGPYQTSITRAIRQFYDGLGGELDARLAPPLAIASIKLAEQTAQAARLAPAPAPRSAPAPRAIEVVVAGGSVAAGPPPTVLVLGGTGFIGRALVRRLRREGLGVRALVRDLGGYAEQLGAAGAELVKGDFTDTASVERALSGITHLYHLARGYGRTWDDYQRLDVEPTRRLAALCLERKIQLLYTSSIAIYCAARAGDVVTEETPPGAGTVRVNMYARAKAEIERVLLDMHRNAGLDVVIFRPGIVIGSGGGPFHWGVGAWPYSSICRVWGDGTTTLPFVLVDECADAMVLALRSPAIAGESFNLVGEPCLTGSEYLDQLERLSGIKVQRLPVPPWRRFVEDIAKYGLKTMSGTERNRPSYEYYVGLSNRARYSPEKAKRRLGWRPSDDRAHVVREGIAVPVAEFVR
jgi:nucleoside-diphosphate-sugar epimerase/predicted dehydrogenase